MAVNDAVDKSLKLLRKQLRKAHATVTVINLLGAIMADKNAELQSSLDDMQSTLDTVQQQITDERAAKKAAADAQQALIDDLKAQLAQGPSGLTEEQATAAIARLADIKSDLLTTPEPGSGGTPTGGGETPVPIGPQ